MIKILCKFICAYSYDFNNEKGERITGMGGYVFSPDTNEILKVRIINSDVVQGLVCGDDIEVTAKIVRNKIKYEV